MLLSLGVLLVSWSCVQAQKLIPPAIVEFAENGTGKVNLDRPGDVKSNGEFELICKASGSPDQMTFTWKHNGNNIVPQRGITFINDPNKPNQQILIVEYVTPRDDGKYQCFVNNAAGGTISTKIRVKVTYASLFKRGEWEKDTVKVNVGESFLLKCPPHDETYKGFGTRYLWGRRQGKKFLTLVINEQRALLPNGDFVFLNFLQSDLDEIKSFPDGTVQCIVSAANTIWNSHQFNLTIARTLKFNQFGPTFTNGDFTPKDQEQAIQGRKKELFCAAAGNPVPKITWYRLRNDKTILKKIENGRDGFLLKDFGRMLTIDAVQKAQHEDGYYQCTASNGVGSDIKSSPTKLRVFVAPKWTVSAPKDLDVRIGSNRKISCEAIGSPPPSYKWYYNGTVFTSDKQLAPNIIVDGGFLTFNNMQKSNEGVFQCLVENDWGTLVSSTWVKAIKDDNTTPSTPSVQPLISTRPACGQQPYTVASGNDATAHSWPWHVSLRVNGRHVCSGALIKPGWVITSAHCVSMRFGASRYTVVVGAHKRFGTTAAQSTFRVKKMYKHGQFSDQSLINDIALLELSGSVQTSSQVNTVCLPQKGTQAQTGKDCYVTGWGRTAVVLRQAKLQVTSHGTCSNTNGKIIPVDKRSMICAGGLGRGGCLVDSGGPLVCKEGSHWVLRGTVSWAYSRCNSGSNTVFARVSNFLDWINRKMS